MRVTQIFSASLAFGAFALTTLAMGQVDPDRTIATINGDTLKGSEYYRRMEFLPGVGKMDNGTFIEAPPGFLTLEQLITERLVLQLAKQKGVAPSDIEVDAELKNRQEDDPNLVKNWTTSNRTMDELKQKVRYELSMFKIQTAGITITDSQVQQHYNENPSTYTNPKQVKLRVIVVTSSGDEAAVDKALAAKTAFADVAKQYSADISKNAGGEFGTVPLAFLNTDTQNAINATKIGQATTWIESKAADGGTRYVKFLLEDVIPESKMALDAKLKRQIRQEMMLAQGGVKNDIRKEMDAMRAKAKIDITEPEFADTYKKFIDAYLKRGG